MGSLEQFELGKKLPFDPTPNGGSWSAIILSYPNNMMTTSLTFKSFRKLINCC